MSGASENRWRRPPGGLSGAQHPRQASGSRDRSNTPSRDKQTGTPPAPGGNVWTRSAAHKSSASQSGAATSAGPRSGAAPTEEKHVPVNGFNSAETKTFLKQSYTRAVSGGDVKHWKPAESGGAGKSGAWGSRPNAMASGQDFWVQLRKQIASLESSSKT